MTRVEVLAPFPHPTVPDVMVGRGSQVDITDDDLLRQLNNEGKVALLEPAVAPGPVQITEVRVENITSASCVIRFSVDQECTDMKANFGPTTDYGTTQPASPTASGSGERSVLLAGLDPETLYHYQISVTSGGADTLSPDNTFTTTA